MAGKKKGLSLDFVADIAVDFDVKRFDEIYPVIHHFREPTAADQKVYWSKLTRMDMARGGRKPKDESGGGNYLDACIALWFRCIIKVEGYAIPDGTTEEQWKGAIRVDEKREAIERLREKCGLVEDTDESKN